MPPVDQDDVADPTPADDIVDKQERHEALIDDMVDTAIAADETGDDLEYAARGVSVVASPTAPSAGYVQAEAAAMKTAVDGIRTALIASGILAAS